jgi:hypothetical protein
MKLSISISGSPVSIPLLGNDDYDIAYDFWNVLPHKLWETQHKSEVISILSNSIRRGRESIKEEHETIRASGLDIKLILRFMADNDKVHLRGDYRYPSTKIAEFLKLNPTKNTPPIQLGGNGTRGFNLLDGHHRWRGYLEAKRKPLALITELVPRKGADPEVHLHIET